MNSASFGSALRTISAYARLGTSFSGSAMMAVLASWLFMSSLPWALVTLNLSAGSVARGLSCRGGVSAGEVLALRRRIVVVRTLDGLRLVRGKLVPVDIA